MEGSDSGGLSSTANSFISLGKFEAMGEDVGRMSTGIAYLEETIRLQEKEYESEVDARRRSLRAMGLAQSLFSIGRQHHQQQDPAVAVQLYRRAQSLYEESIAAREGEQSERATKAVVYAQFALTEVYSGLGVAHNDLGQHDEALAALHKALELRKALVGKGHPSLAECVNNLGALYFARGNLQRAVEHYEQALDLLTLGGEGRQEGAYVALALYNIGVCRIGLGQTPAGTTALERALVLAEASLGVDHRQVAMIRATLQQLSAARRERVKP